MNRECKIDAGPEKGRGGYEERAKEEGRVQ